MGGKHIVTSRMTAEIEGDFVVFIIGARINKKWKVHRWLPVARAFSKVMRELEGNPEIGMLAHRTAGGASIQYWRSFDHLEAYARNRRRSHWPAWLDFNTRVAKRRGDVGIWHETFLVRDGAYEAIYSGVPAMGLGLAGAPVPISAQRESAGERVRSAAPSR